MNISTTIALWAVSILHRELWSWRGRSATPSFKKVKSHNRRIAIHYELSKFEGHSLYGAKAPTVMAAPDANCRCVRPNRLDTWNETEPCILCRNPFFCTDHRVTHPIFSISSIGSAFVYSSQDLALTSVLRNNNDAITRTIRNNADVLSSSKSSSKSSNSNELLQKMSI